MITCRGVASDSVNTTEAQLQALAEALRERRRLIGDREFYARDPVAHLSALERVSEHIRVKATEIPSPTPPQLAHFLERCSYDKALAWIESAAGDA